LVSVMLVVFAVNAVNLFDGLDGLAGSVGLVTALGLAWLVSGRGIDPDVPLELGAALLGFLIFGWRPARVFLGDAGAYVLGVVLAHVMISSAPEGTLQLIVGAGLMGIFAVDLVATMMRRRLSGHPMFTGDRSHIYDQLVDRGWSVPGVALVMSAVQAAIVVIVVGVDQMLASWGAVVVLTAILIGVLVLLSRLGFLRPEPRQARNPT
jgi:UDP-GlcNAc:undecaprenyl-phosphate GlcNAc-1-phosphate transferase